MNIVNNCKKISNNIFNYNYLGQRNSKYDIKVNFSDKNLNFDLLYFEDN